MTQELLLVGSIPLDTAEDVFRRFAPLAEWLPYMPDGELGERQYWVDGIAYHVFARHPDLEILKWPAPDPGGIERWKPRGRHDEFQFRVRPGVDRVRFGDPGWRLGFARDAINSYFVFRTLKREGVIPAGVRFQVCIPLTYSSVFAFFPDPDDHAKVIPGFTEALRAETETIVAHIPPDDLAIQWDAAIEERHIEAALESGGPDAAREVARREFDCATEICRAIPESVALGYHACFGTLEGWPSRQPKDLTGAVLLMNAAVAASGRRVDFLHFPTIGTAADAFFAPLANLRPEGARVYVGALHHLHGADGIRRQLELARKYLPDFGVAAPCGFGRTTERPGRLLPGREPVGPDEMVQEIVADHIAGVQILRDVLKA
jgi:hypothetical protein